MITLILQAQLHILQGHFLTNVVALVLSMLATASAKAGPPLGVLSST